MQFMEILSQCHLPSVHELVPVNRAAPEVAQRDVGDRDVLPREQFLHWSRQGLACRIYQNPSRERGFARGSDEFVHLCTRKSLFLSVHLALDGAPSACILPFGNQINPVFARIHPSSTGPLCIWHCQFQLISIHFLVRQKLLAQLLKGGALVPLFVV